MNSGFRIRLYLLTALILTGFGVLLSRLHEFQIERQKEFQAMLPGNRTVSIREPGIRGEIIDRNGIALARNLRNYYISFNLDEIVQAYQLQNEDTPQIASLVKRNGFDRTSKNKDIVKIVNDWTIKPLKELGLATNYNAAALRTHYSTHGGLVPFTYRTDLSYGDFAILAERNLEFPGVTLGLKPQRQYPYGTLASHVLGYLKQWEKGDVSSADKREFDHYIGEEKGIAGIEATMDEYLRGPEGKKTILKDEKSRTIGMIDYTKPGIGATVQLAIDAKIQFLLENTLRRAGRAAGVVMDVNTGEIIAMASVPDYNPNLFIPSISRENFLAYQANPQLSPFTNRAIAPFEPGSTMKIPTAIAGAMRGIATNTFNCTGYVPYGKHKIGCWIWNKSKGSHGSLRLPEAIQKSCNPYFIRMSNTIGWNAMAEGCSLVGFGKNTGVELPNENPGILPGSRAWRTARPGASMTPALTAMMSIGQGDMLATPIQMAAMTNAIANGGKYYQPRLVKKINAHDGKNLVPDSPKLIVDLLANGVKESDLALIREGMRKAVNESGGTAGKVKMEKIVVAAKTGTAQTTDNGKKSNNSWIISFAPFDKPKYSITILVQAGGSGGGVCGPLINTIYTGIFAQENGFHLPLKSQTEYKGHLDRIEEIEPLKDILAAIEASEIQDAETIASEDDDSSGETGDEAGEILPLTPLLVKPNITAPSPTITPEIDREGLIIPRAIPIPE